MITLQMNKYLDRIVYVFRRVQILHLNVLLSKEFSTQNLIQNVMQV